MDCIFLFLRNLNTRVEVLIAVIVTLIRLAYGNFGLADLAVVIAVSALWPLGEWIGANIQHLQPLKIGKWTLYSDFQRVHMEHHQRPWDLSRTNAPISTIVFLSPVFALLWWAITPNWSLALSAMWAQAIGTVLYEWAHFLAHTGYVPKSRYFRMMRKHHLLHHFKNHNYWYGFLTPIIDRLMGTNPNPKDVETFTEEFVQPQYSN